MANYRRVKKYHSGFAIPTMGEFPPIPTPGMPIIKGDMLYMCMEKNGVPYWVPAVRKTASAKFEMTSVSRTWSFYHELGEFVSAVCYDTDGEVLRRSDIREIKNIIHENGIGYTLSIRFRWNQRGTVVVFGMDSGSTDTEMVPVDISGGEIELAFRNAEAKIDQEAEQLRVNFLSAGAGQMLEYQATSEELVRFKTDPNPVESDYPFLAAELGLLGDSLAEIAVATEYTVAAWASFGSDIKRKRRTAKEALKAAKEAGDIPGMIQASNVNWF